MNREDQTLSLSESRLDAGDVDLGAFSPAHPCRAETRLSPSARSGAPHGAGSRTGG